MKAQTKPGNDSEFDKLACRQKCPLHLPPLPRPPPPPPNGSENDRLERESADVCAKSVEKTGGDQSMRRLFPPLEVCRPSGVGFRPKASHLASPGICFIGRGGLDNRTRPGSKRRPVSVFYMQTALRSPRAPCCKLLVFRNTGR